MSKYVSINVVEKYDAYFICTTYDLVCITVSEAKELRLYKFHVFMEYVDQMVVFWVVTPRGIVRCCIELNQM